MAEGWNVNPSSRNAKIDSHCRYFKRGNCMYGESCRFIHDTTLPESVKINISHPSFDRWVNAPEFIPSNLTSLAENECAISNSDGLKSYAQALDPSAGSSSGIATSASELCPYFMLGFCRYGEECLSIHGDLCELCNQFCLHPFDELQRQQHNEECLRRHEADMEHSFAIARSREKSCGICMEVIWDKQPAEKQRFGLLPNCSHCFCLDCIRKWRQSKQFENKIVRSCPECRVQSDYVCPSRYWCETKEEKEKFIEDYKQALGKKPCKYFNEGRGECPFGNKCFYLHALPDGTRADVGPPQRKNRRRRFALDDGADEIDIVQLLLWDFLEERENRLYLQLGLDFDELDDFPSTDSDSDIDYH